MSASRFVESILSESIRTFFDASPTMRMLRSDNAPFIVDFLHRVFKSGELISLGLSELRLRLTNFQDELHETDRNVLTGPVDRYLNQWVDSGWLQRFLEATSSEPQYQLTKYAEEAIQFVDSSLARGRNIVGTESRLRLVMDTLEDIVRGASADPDRRLEFLRQQRGMIDAEIESIESGKSIQVYRPAQIRERFQTAVELLKALQADFRAVEDRFQTIAREVQQLHASGSDSRGNILGHALDSEDLLKQQDEGISFTAFVSFLLSPTQQSQLRNHIEEIQQLDALFDESESMQRVRRMVPALLAEADKVMRTTSRLSATLRRLLDAKAAEHRVRLASVLRDIRQLAMRARGSEELCEVQLEIQSHADIQSPLARTFWVASETFESTFLMPQVVDVEQAKAMACAFAKLQRLDLRKLRKFIREATLDGESILLTRLLNEKPIEGGIVELLGYMQIAHDDGHSIDRNQYDSIRLSQPKRHDSSLSLLVPRITFLPKASTRDTPVKPK